LNFIDQGFTKIHKILLIKKTMRVPLQVINNMLIASGVMSHYTSPSELFFEKYNEKISLNVILLYDYNVVLSIL
jgi:hypothetical protein